MKKVPVKAQLLAPVAIKRDRQSERSESVRSVAGTLVRGALAAIYLQHHGQVDDTFKHLFLNEASCRFGPLDPGPQPFPLTAASCKREGIKHGLVDQLWFRIAQHHMAGDVPEDASAAAWRQCNKCKADLKGHDGFYQEESNRLCESSKDRHQVAAHVGIDRQTATAAESILYTLEAMLPSGQEVDLYGWLMADDDALADLEQLLEDEDHRISVGHHRTRGYGDVRLQLDEAIEMDLHTENWERWSRGLIAFLGSLLPSVSDSDLDPKDFYFSLSFPTGAVFVDRFLRYTIDPADMISWLPAMPSVDAAFPIQNRPSLPFKSGGTIGWVAAITRHERLRGWNAAHGLPRQDEWAVARGAVYVYRFQGTTEERDALIQKLAILSQDGVGLRRNEGFGMVVVSDDFHYRFHKQEVLS